MSLRTSSPRTVSVKGSASEPRRPLGSTAGRQKQRRAVKSRLHFATNVSPAHNTHLEHPVYLDLVSDLVLVHGEDLLYPHHDDCDKRTLLIAAGDFCGSSKSNLRCYSMRNDRALIYDIKSREVLLTVKLLSYQNPTRKTWFEGEPAHSCMLQLSAPTLTARLEARSASTRVIVPSEEKEMRYLYVTK